MSGNRRILPVLALLTACVFSCESSDPPSANQLFAIYTLSDSTAGVSEVSNIPLEELVLSGKPFLDVNHIRSYDWADHSITLTPCARAKMRALEKEFVQTKPFVLIAGSERIYLGGFWAAFSSLGRYLPHIAIHPMDRGAIRIREAWPLDRNGADLRNDARINRCLAEAGVLVAKQSHQLD